jgi:glycosyltransferase involved in cell wall biosynthesis
MENNNFSNILVSIIVPVFNGYMYLNKCLTSLSNQTHVNCEFLLINDGSTDNAKEVLHYFSKKDERFKVIDKKINTGVSNSRNIGLKLAKGKYLIFVDSDDYIAENHVEYLLGLIIKSDSNMALSDSCFIGRNEIDNTKEKVFFKSGKDLIKDFLLFKIIVGCWNKIYKKEFLIKNSISFDEELFYGEGLLFIIKVSILCERVVIGNKKTYFYRRNNSNSATSSFDINKIKNGELALVKISSFFINNTNGSNYLTIHLLNFYAGSLLRIYSLKLQKSYKKEIITWKKYFFKNLYLLLKTNFINSFRKIFILFSFSFPYLFSKFYSIRRLFIKNTSV